MASKTQRKTHEREQWAFEQLVKCRNLSAVVAELAEREGISLRRSRELVAKAYERLVADVNGCADREALLAQCIGALQQGLEKSLAAGQVAWAIGCVRQLDDLLGLGINHPGRPSPPGQYGRR
ncbi:conserved hypothetical protein [Cyanobium sp. PCC 7001]|uniref:hypothetical protein n=1 Tax=Cyanobium sp. PCC 7001 TaxID=180281 RepID=UPI0001805323|nr:hypothetical protein [Cyanobium sp. PCC 7001]EDY37638.1 conserved hypothetical protein [Cyanobium sp. PCC 7001]